MEQYAKYLRKSRFDRDYAELSIEETLKRHEAILDKLAGDRGFCIARTYYEVVSGESIAARPEIQKLLEEVRKSGNVILFIDELHTIVGAGSAEGAVDAANIIKPALGRGEIQIIGATTLNEYRKYIEKDLSLIHI